MGGLAAAKIDTRFPPNYDFHESGSHHTGKLLRCRDILLFMTGRSIHFTNAPCASLFIPYGNCHLNSNGEFGMNPDDTFLWNFTP